MIRILWCCMGISLLACGPTGQKEGAKASIFDTLNRRTKIRLYSYMSNGQRLYRQYCANCHQKNGQGLRRLIPPLRESDYLSAHSKVACIIKYGARGPMIVSGKAYDAVMPASPTLRDIQIAEIMSYIGNVWGNHEGLISVKEVSRYLDNCP